MFIQIPYVYNPETNHYEATCEECNQLVAMSHAGYLAMTGAPIPAFTEHACSDLNIDPDFSI